MSEETHRILLNESDGGFKVGLECLEFGDYREFAKFERIYEHRKRQCRSALNYAKSLAKFLGLPFRDEVYNPKQYSE